MAGERVTEAELREVVLDAVNAVANFIADAHVIVDDLLTGKGLTEAKLKLIEKYLAAHLYTLSQEHGGLVREKIGEAEQQFASPGSGTGLRSTRFGAMALTLDPTGTLEANLVGGSKKALFRVVSPADDGTVTSC